MNVILQSTWSCAMMDIIAISPHELIVLAKEHDNQPVWVASESYKLYATY